MFDELGALDPHQALGGDAYGLPRVTCRLLTSPLVWKHNLGTSRTYLLAVAEPID